ncbi:hypothetical protein [Coxiella-like endosymbiont of Rhipicephalus sanguineus]
MVADFRCQDMALGDQVAPLACFP